MTPEMRALATYLTNQYEGAGIMTAPAADPEFAAITKAFETEFRCRSCGLPSWGLGSIHICTTCLTDLYR